MEPGIFAKFAEYGAWGLAVLALGMVVIVLYRENRASTKEYNERLLTVTEKYLLALSANTQSNHNLETAVKANTEVVKTNTDVLRDMRKG